MKKFISKVQNLSQKAAELKAAMQQVPPRVAEIREAVTSTAGQLQQLKSQIHFSIADLKADNEDRLSEALQEINASTEAFRKAGFTVTGVDIEVSPVQRMLVHLTRVEDVHPSMLRSLASHNQQRRATHAILSALLQARQMADTVELDHLAFDEVAVSVGPIPSVRICWRTEHATEPLAHAPSAQPPPVPAVDPPPTTVPQSFFGQSSFFEQRTVPAPAGSPAAAEKPAQGAVPTILSAATGAAKPSGDTVSPTGTEARQDPLARFKKMPDFAKGRG